LTKFDQLAAAMKGVRPTVFVAVPRVYEKIRQAVEGSPALSPVKARFWRWALRRGEASAEDAGGKTPGGVGWMLANKLVFSKIREAFGGCAEVFISGVRRSDGYAGWCGCGDSDL